MRRLIIYFLTICVLAKVKAAPEISLEDLRERLVTLEDWKRETEVEMMTLRETVTQQGAIIKNLEKELAIQVDLTETVTQQGATIKNLEKEQAIQADLTETVAQQGATIKILEKELAIQADLTETVAQQGATIKILEKELAIQADLTETVAQQGPTIKNLERELAIQANLTATNCHSKQDDDQDIHAHKTEEDTGNDGHASNNMIRSTDIQIPAQPSSLSKRAIAGGVAFTAYLDHDVELGGKQTIKFNGIITNDGNGYSIHTGVFICPEAGVYLFSFSIGERSETGGNESYTNLVVNSQRVVSAVVETMHAYQDLQGGNTAVVRLNQGDSVWVEANSVSHVEGGYRITTFTGVYLYA